MLGVGISLTNCGIKGGVADVTDGGGFAYAALGTELEGLAMDFRDMSYALRDAAYAEVLLGSETSGFAVDFRDMIAVVRV